MNELKPCPFCGGEVSIIMCDDEGNLHDESYREHPYSGLGFMLHHAHEENPGCPIASYECDGGILGGVYIYDTDECPMCFLIEGKYYEYTHENGFCDRGERKEGAD